jgi:transposase
MREYALGIDVAKDKLDVVLWSRQPKVSPRYHKFANTPAGQQQLVAWIGLSSPQSVHVCLEATGTYGEAVAERLYEAGYPVSIVNPLRVKRYGESELSRQKTDKGDAALIARFTLAQEPTLWTPLSTEQRDLRALVRGLLDLEDLARRHQQRASSGGLRAVLAPQWEQMQAQFQQQIQRLQEQIRQYIADSKTLSTLYALYVSISGIGEKTGWVLLAELGDVSRFESGRQVVAYLGLAPHLHQSGRSLHGPSPLDKAGNASLRKALYWPAISAAHHNAKVRPLYERLLAQGRPKLVAIGAAMRKLVLVVYAVVHAGKPFDPAYQRPAC